MNIVLTHSLAIHNSLTPFNLFQKKSHIKLI